MRTLAPGGLLSTITLESSCTVPKWRISIFNPMGFSSSTPGAGARFPAPGAWPILRPGAGERLQHGQRGRGGDVFLVGALLRLHYRQRSQIHNVLHLVPAVQDMHRLAHAH